MTKAIVLASILVCILIPFHSSAQEANGGPILFEPTPCLTETQRADIIAMLKHNQELLHLPDGNPNKIAATLFDWPIKQAAGFNDPGFYAIFNYVDEDPTYPNHLLDYNCGARTYDLASGYNHKGTDIGLSPFAWNKMDNNAVEIVAGAAGTIIGKSDGNFDKNCAMNNLTWNAVYIQQADGSVAWYGHMKSGSLTSKIVGNTVAKGEKIGLVGSSGSSTGPHLHFEVYTNNTYTQLVDPWGGACNAFNGNTSWWASQQAYHVPTLNLVATHNTVPSPYGCPAAEKTNFKNAFMPSDSIYFGTYYRDQENASTVTMKVYKPDNSIWANTSYTFNIYYSSSYLYWSYKLPSNAPTGTWKCEVVYNSKTVTHNFTVGTVSAVQNNKNIPRINCYPNPATNSISVDLNIQAETAEIYNNLMQLVATQSLTGIQNTTTISVDQLSEGIYFLVLRDHAGAISGQNVFVKE